MSFLPLLSTLAYNSDGTPVATGYIQTVPSAGKSATWTSTLGTATALTVSTLIGSTVSFRNTTTQTLSGVSTLVGSTISLTNITTGSIGVSTLMGSSISTNQVSAGAIGFSTLTGSSIATNQVSAGAIGFSTLTGSTLTTGRVSATTLSVTSTMIQLGPNTQSTMVNASQGSYATTSWQTSKSSLGSTRTVAMSSTGQYQIIVSDSTADLWLSSDSGVTWSTLNGSSGLPTLSAPSYWSAGSISADGQSIMLAVYGGSLWFSSDYGRTFATSAQPTPTIWLPLNGSTSDIMGASTITATGSPGYVTVNQPGYSSRAIQFANVAGETATQYARGNWTGSSNFTVSLWFNAQTLGVEQVIYDSYNLYACIRINSANSLFAVVPTGGGSNFNTIGLTTVTANQWYHVTLIFQTNGLCSFYVNNALNGTLTNTLGVGSLSTTQFSLGSFTNNTLAFNGYIADVRIYNSAITYVPVPHFSPAYWLPMEGSVADSGSYSTVQTASPTIYLPLEGSTTDIQGVSTVTPYGSPSYVTNTRVGAPGNQSLYLANTAGGTATQYVKGTWAGSPNFTVSFWFNAQTVGVNYQYICSAYNGAFAITLNSANALYVVIPSGGGTSYTTIGPYNNIQSNTWYYVTCIFQTNGLCSLYVNNILVASATNSQGTGTLTTTTFAFGGFDTAGNVTAAFNGYIDEVKIYNTAFVNSIAFSPTPSISISFEGTVADTQGVSTVTAYGSPAYTTSVRAGALGTRAINLANTAGGTLNQYVEGSWNRVPNFSYSFWFNPQTVNGTGQIVFSAQNTITQIFISQVTNRIVLQYPTNGSVASIATSYDAVPNTWYYVLVIFQTDGLCSFYVNNTLIGSATNVGGFGSYTATNIFRLGGYDTTTNAPFNGYIDDFKIYNYAINPTPVAANPTIYLPFEGSVADLQGSTAVTAYGSPAYTSSVRLGATGIRALNLTNPSISSISSYVTANITLGNSFTISGWFNYTSYPPSGNKYFIWSLNGTINVVQECTVSDSGQFVCSFYNSSSSSIIVATANVSINTWNHVYFIYQESGTCYAYLNGILIGSVAGSPLNQTPIVVGFGGSSRTTYFGLNGYLDDFRLWNTAIPYTPVSIIQPTGTMKYVRGAVGQTALSLENTAGVTPTNLIRGNCSLGNNFTISAWINFQSLTSVNGTFSNFFSMGNANNTNVITFYHQPGEGIAFKFANSSIVYISVGVTNSFSLNTWYHFHFVFQVAGTCSVYFNGTLLGSVAGQSLYGPIDRFYLGCASNGTDYAFNGYIDDFKIYNAAIPYSSLFPANYSHLTMSGNGLYRMAALKTGSQSGRLMLSSDSGSTWSLQTTAATPGAWSSLSASYSGKYLTAQSQPVVTPNQLNLASSTWTQQGVTYTVTASSEYSGDPSYAYYAFNNSLSTPWGSASARYTAGNGGGSYEGSVTTYLQTIGSVRGEWIMIRTSVPVILDSYSYAGFNFPQVAKTYYIAGSNDGTTWYPLQYANTTINPLNAFQQSCSSYLKVNYTGRQTIIGGTIGSCDTIAYPYATQAFQYFVLIGTSIWPGATNYGLLSYAELYYNFIGGSITPNQSGLTSSTWTQSGVSWTASASSVYAGDLSAYKAFDNTLTGTSRWVSVLVGYNTTTGAFTGSYSTTIQTIGSILGEWLQLQSSIPVVLQSYTFWSGGNSTYRMPKQYYIVGSNDGSTWYPLQYVNMTTNPLTTDDTKASTSIIMNYTGTQTIQGNQSGSGSTTAYSPYVTQAFQYFRIIVSAIYPSNDGIVDIGEFLPVFTVGQNSSTNYGLTWTPTLQTGDAFNVTKNLTVTSGSGWVQLPAFTPIPTSGFTFSFRLTFTSALLAYGTILFAGDVGLTYSPNAITVFTNSNGSITFGQYISGSLTFAINSSPIFTTNQEYHIVWTVDGLSNHRIYVNGVVDVTGSAALNAITYPYSKLGGDNISMTVRDFRMFNRALNAAEVGKLYANVNYGLPATGPISLSRSGEYALVANGTIAGVGSGYLSQHQSTTYSNPLLSGIDAPIIGSAVSQTGQYMVAVTSSGSNNVYYSTDYGATFSALSINGSSFTTGTTPLARLTLDNTNADSQGTLVPAAGAGTVTYSTSIVRTGTHSAYFTQSTPGLGATTFLNYTIPSSLNSPSAITMACWAYPTTLATNMTPMALNSGGATYGPEFYINSSGIVNFYWATTSNNGGTSLSSTTTITANTWSHLAFTYFNGTLILYVNGIQVATTISSGTLCLVGGGNLTNLMVGVAVINYNAFSGYIDDVRVYTSALSPTEIASLASALPLTSCAISHDGSYITVSNASAVYTLNKNATGYSVAVGSQAGQINQASNAIAIGNKAATVNQSANSIVLNATGSTLGTGASGFYVAPIGPTSGLNIDLLGYGADSQVVTSGITVAPGGYVGIGVTNPTFQLQVGNQSGLTGTSSNLIGSIGASYIRLQDSWQFNNWYGYEIAGKDNGVNGHDLVFRGRIGPLSDFVEHMRIKNSGVVGIGTTNPSAKLHINLTDTSAYPTGLTVLQPNASTGYGPAIRLGVTTAACYNSAALYFNNTAANSQYNFINMSVACDGTGGLIVNGYGNVGVGVTAPATKFHVEAGSSTGVIGTFLSSSLAAGSNNSITIGKSFTSNNCVTILHNHIADGSTSNFCGIGYYGGDNKLNITANGKIGIGTTSPITMLHIASSVPNDDDYSLMTFYQNTNTSYHDWAIGPFTRSGQASFGIRSGSDNVPSNLTDIIYINGYGTVIKFSGYTSNGTMTTTNSDGTIVVSSDRRIKENIVYQTDTKKALENVMALKPATYSLIGSTGSYLGFIAQDLEQEIPLAVDGKKYEWLWEVDATGNPKFDADGNIIWKLDRYGNRIIRPRGVNDRAIIAVQTLAIQEQQQQIAGLKASLADKSAQLDALLTWARTQGFTESP